MARARPSYCDHTKETNNDQSQDRKREQWLAARLKLLEAEKALTRRSDELARWRQELPWVRIDKEYRFQPDEGTASLADLFTGRSQLLIYHFMFGPEYTAGCPSCSAIADGFDGFVVHLANHDVTLCAVSRAPLAKLQAYKRRMGWSFPWASSFVRAEGDDRQLGRRLDMPQAVLNQRLSDALPPPALGNRKPADSVVWSVGCREEQSTHQRRARSTVLLTYTEGRLTLNVPLKRGMEAWICHHRPKLFTIDQYLGVREIVLQDTQRMLIAPTRVYARPDRMSFNWIQLGRGITVTVERQRGDFTQISYQEWDRQAEPAYVSYQITGWVPSEVLTQTHWRHFFTLTTSDTTPERWQHTAEQVLRFTLFWTPLDALPPLRSSQASWLALFMTSQAAQELNEPSE